MKKNSIVISLNLSEITLISGGREKLCDCPARREVFYTTSANKCRDFCCSSNLPLNHSLMRWSFGDTASWRYCDGRKVKKPSHFGFSSQHHEQPDLLSDAFPFGS